MTKGRSFLVGLLLLAALPSSRAEAVLDPSEPALQLLGWMQPDLALQ